MSAYNLFLEADQATHHSIAWNVESVTSSKTIFEILKNDLDNEKLKKTNV